IRRGPAVCRCTLQRPARARRALMFVQCHRLSPEPHSQQRTLASSCPISKVGERPSSTSTIASPATGESVAVAAPIEQVVDPHLHHLNVAVALGESVAGEEREPSRNSKCPIVQPQIIILD